MKKTLYLKSIVLLLTVILIESCAVSTLTGTIGKVGNIKDTNTIKRSFHTSKLSITPNHLQTNERRCTYSSFNNPRSNSKPVFNGPGDQLHPALERTSTGTLIASYRDNSTKNITWTFSTDDGNTFDYGISYGYAIGDFGDYPSLKLWEGTRLFGTATTSSHFLNGGATFLFETTDPTDYNTYWLNYGDWFSYGWYGMIDSAIACDNSQNPWEWGICSYVMSTTYQYGPPYVNGPTIVYSDPSGSGIWIDWFNQNNCAHTDIDIDHGTATAYAVYDQDASLNGTWKLLCWVKDFSDPLGGLNELYEISGNENLQNPVIAVNNNHLVILAETTVNNNKDIVCFYSNNGIQNLQTSIVANGVDDEIYPDIRFIENTTFACTFIKNGNLYKSISEDGGATWAGVEKINDGNGTVVEEYKTSDLCGKAKKILWEDERGEDIDIYIGNALTPTAPPVTSIIKGYVTNPEGMPLSGVKIDVWNNSWYWGNQTFTNEEGYYEIGLFGGWFNFSATNELFYSFFSVSLFQDNMTYLWNLTLWPYDTVCGYVRDHEGNPIENATVHLNAVYVMNHYFILTNESGFFIFYKNISAGTYESEVYKTGENGFPPRPGERFNVLRNETHWLNFTIEQPVFIWVDDEFNESTPGWGIDHFNKIQNGIDVATPESTIYVYNGIYYENVVLNKMLNLIGENKEATIIDGSGRAIVIFVCYHWADHSNITGFTLRNGSHVYNGGIYVCSDYNNIYDNKIIDTHYGIWMKGSSHNKVIKNTIENCYHTGIILEKKNAVSSGDNCIYHNNFINNTQQASDGCNNSWDNGYPSGGNYWSDYNGTDGNGDGIGDTPYNILWGEQPRSLSLNGAMG